MAQSKEQSQQGLIILMGFVSLLIASGVVFAAQRWPAILFKVVQVMGILLAASLVMCRIYLPLLKRNAWSGSPAMSVKSQGRAFLYWFAMHNLSWSLAGIVGIWLVLGFLGPGFLGLVLTAGATACVVFALLGMAIPVSLETLAVCWKAPLGKVSGPGAMHLSSRYEAACRFDLGQSRPVLPGLTRILDRANFGGADRGVDLMGTSVLHWSSEVLVRFKNLTLLFLTAALLAGLILAFGGVQEPKAWSFSFVHNQAESSNPDETQRVKNPSKNRSNVEQGGAGPEARAGENGRNQDAVGGSSAQSVSGEENAKDSGQPSSSQGEGASSQQGPEKPGSNPGEPEPGDESGPGQKQEMGKDPGGSQRQELKSDGNQASDHPDSGAGDGESTQPEGQEGEGVEGKSAKDSQGQGSGLGRADGSEPNGTSDLDGKPARVPIPQGGGDMLTLDLPHMDAHNQNQTRSERQSEGDIKPLQEGETPDSLSAQSKRASSDQKQAKAVQNLPNWIRALIDIR